MNTFHHQHYHPIPFWKAVHKEYSTHQKQQQRRREQQLPHLTEQASWLAVFGMAYVFLYDNFCHVWTQSHLPALPAPCDDSLTATHNLGKTMYGCVGVPPMMCCSDEGHHSDVDNDDDHDLPRSVEVSFDSNPSPESLDAVQVMAMLFLSVLAAMFFSTDEQDGDELVRFLVVPFMAACRYLHAMVHPVSGFPLLQ